MYVNDNYLDINCFIIRIYLLMSPFHSVLTFADNRLAEANGPLSADNAEAHFYYGKSLLEQSRLELSVFDGGVPAEKGEDSEESSGDEDEDDEEKEEEGDDEDKKDKSSEEVEGKMETDNESDEAEEKQDSSLMKSKEQGDDAKVEEDLSTPSPIPTSTPTTSNVVQDGEQPSTSSGITAAETNGADKEGEEELSNLELAWEVLEIAKLGYDAQLKLALDQLKTPLDVDEEKSKTKTKLHLQKRLSETHSLLGEVATESENYPQAVEDFKIAIKILLEIEGEDSREVAQYYFQMGLAHSFAKEFQEAIESFKKSKSIIELRISNLQFKIDNKQTAKDLGLELEDPSNTEDEEISELQALLPELDEKVADTIDAERESKATIAEEIQEREIALKNSPVKNPNPPAVNDISHLVKKKKKAEEQPIDVPPAKRVCSDSSSDSTTIVSTSKTEQVTSTNGHENGSSVKKSMEF